jgi:exopolysaccharide biosynthesis polyprenyl glycosylphosphotransferase
LLRLIAVDVLATWLALLLSVRVTATLNPSVFPGGCPDFMTLMGTNPHLPAGWILTLVWLGTLYVVGGYQPAKLSTVARLTAVNFRAALGVLGCVAALHLGLRTIDWSRMMVASFIVTSTLSLVVLRSSVLMLKPDLLDHRPRQMVAIIGVGERALNLANRLEEYGHHAFSLAGHITPDSGSSVFQVPATKVLGCVLDLPDLVKTHGLGVLILASDRLNRDEHMMLANRAHSLGVNLLEVPSTWGMANPRMSLAEMGDLQLVDLTSLAYPTQAERLKRTFDLIVGGLGGLFLCPILLSIGLAIRLADGGPALFTQARTGRGGRPFEMYKFRSMVEGADKLRPALEMANEAEGVLFKIEADPRITPIGLWIRRWSIDEIPQLINVLKGEMNLVGPRPLPVDDIQRLGENVELQYWFTQRSKVKPGITGTWQVSNRDSLKMEDMVRLDIDYIQHWNFFSDLAILIRTIPAVFKGRGAR